MKRVSIILGVMVMVLCAVVSAEETAKVIKVVDGETILVELDGKEETVKYIGVASAQSEEMSACRDTAKDKNEKLIGGRHVTLELGEVERDGDGNLLAYVFIKTAAGALGKDVFLNEEMIWEGLGVISLEAPNLEYADVFEAAQKRARKKKVGLWGDAECKRIIEEPKVDPNCMFIGHRVSRIYHTADCEHGKRITIVNKVCFKSKKEAEKAGYRACKNCEE